MERHDFPYELDIYPFPFHLVRMTAVPRESPDRGLRGALERGPVSTPDDHAFLDRLEQTLGTEVRPNHLGSVYGTMIERLTGARPGIAARSPVVAPWTVKLPAHQGRREHDHYLFFRSVFMGQHAAWGTTQMRIAVLRPPRRLLRSATSVHTDCAREPPKTVPGADSWIVLMSRVLGYRHEPPTRRSPNGT